MFCILLYSISSAYQHSFGKDSLATLGGATLAGTTMSGIPGPRRRPRIGDVVRLCGLDSAVELLGSAIEGQAQEVDLAWDALFKDPEKWGTGVKGPMEGSEAFRVRKRSGSWYSVPIGDWDLWSTAWTADEGESGDGSDKRDSEGWLWPSDGARARRGVAIFRHSDGGEAVVLIDLDRPSSCRRRRMCGKSADDLRGTG